MYTKLEISGIIEVKTGLHIGGSTEFSAIGAVDSPVMRDAGTNEPIIPGSSLKGKMRTLLARSKGGGIAAQEPNDDPAEVARLFGTSTKGNIVKSRLIFSDCFINRACKEKFEKIDVGLTEVKFENSINRSTAIANPRQIERVVRGVEFDFRLIYDAVEEAQIIEDFENIKEGFKLLQLDYLGGNGTRGHGRIAFKGIEVKAVFGNISQEILDKCRALLKEFAEEVQPDEILCV